MSSWDILLSIMGVVFSIFPQAEHSLLGLLHMTSTHSHLLLELLSPLHTMKLLWHPPYPNPHQNPAIEKNLMTHFPFPFHYLHLYYHQSLLNRIIHPRRKVHLIMWLMLLTEKRIPPCLEMLQTLKCSGLIPRPRLSLYDGDLFSDPTLYWQTVGSLQYLTLTRPDNTFAVNQVR